MILINKNAANEPNSWVQYKNTPGVSYAPSNDLRNALLAEQGYICAFCMRTIPLSKKDPSENETSKIAHLVSRANDPARWGDYANMVACCPGNINGQAHCDKSQESLDVTMPMFNIQLQNSITYRSHTGEISSSNAGWDAQIKTMLNLNNSLLKLNRIEALKGIRQTLETKKMTRAKIVQKIEKWSSIDSDGKLKPYCGMVIWYLQKKLRAAA
jgi:hypothetical protein